MILRINGTEFPYPTKLNINYSPVEQVNQSEAGTDQVIVARASKATADMEFQLTSMKYQTLKAYSEALSLTVILPEAGLEISRTMRIRNFKADFVENSRLTPGTSGLWRVSCEFIEF